MRLAPQIALVMAGRGLNSLISLLFVPYLARALPLTDYGTYGQVLMVTDFFKALFALGLAQIITVHLAKYPKEEGKVLGSNLFLGLLSGCVAIALLFVSANWIGQWFDNEALAPYLQLYVWSIVLAIVFESINATLIFFGKIKESVLIIVLGNFLKIVLLVVAIQVYGSMSLIFWGLMAAILFQVLLGALFLPNKQLSLVKEWVQEQFQDGFPLGLSSVANVVALTVDSFMVSIFLGTSAYAVYRNGVIQIPFLDTIYHSVALVVMPALTTLFFNKKKKEIISLKKRIIVQSAGLMYPPLIFILVFHYPLIVTYLSEKYVESALIFFMFNLGLFWRINYYQDLPLIAQKTGYILKVFLLGLVVNIGLNYLLIPQLGLLGAVSSTLVVSMLVCILLFRKTIELLDTRFSDLVEWRKLIKIALIPSCIMLVVYGIYLLIPNLILLLVMGGCSVLFSYFLFLKLNLLEKEIAQHFFNKIPVLGKWLIRLIE